MLQVVDLEDGSQPVEKPKAPKNIYPANGRHTVNLICENLKGLGPKQWLSSSIIDLYSL
jgi:Ulp1 family protease